MEDIEDDFLPAIPYVKILLSLALLFAFIPLGGIFGQCNFFAGPAIGGATPIFSALIQLGIYGFLVHCGLVFPLVHQAYPALRNRSPAARGLIALALISAPLISYAYFRGGVKEVMDVQEIFLMIVPGTALAVLFYEITERVWVLSAVLILATFIPLFLTNDLLCRFPTLLTYGSNGPGFYLMRTFSPVLSVWTAIFLTQGKSEHDREPLRNLTAGLIGMVVYCIIAQGLIPITVALIEKNELSRYVLYSFWGIPFLVAIALLTKRNLWTFRILFVGFSIQLLALTFALGIYFTNAATTFWDLVWLTQTLSMLFFTGLFLYTLSKKEVRQMFG